MQREHSSTWHLHGRDLTYRHTADLNLHPSEMIAASFISASRRTSDVAVTRIDAGGLAAVYSPSPAWSRSNDAVLFLRLLKPLVRNNILEYLMGTPIPFNSSRHCYAKFTTLDAFPGNANRRPFLRALR